MEEVPVVPVLVGTGAVPGSSGVVVVVVVGSTVVVVVPVGAVLVVVSPEVALWRIEELMKVGSIGASGSVVEVVVVVVIAPVFGSIDVVVV